MTNKEKIKFLILGHGHKYSEIRCHPITIRSNEWINEEYVFVDEIPDVNPDVVFKLGSYKWSFAEDKSYNCIIDCTGGILRTTNYDRSKGWVPDKYKNYSEEIFDEIERILRPGGEFHSDIRHPGVYKKILNDGLCYVQVWYDYDYFDTLPDSQLYKIYNSFSNIKYTTTCIWNNTTTCIWNKIKNAAGL